MARMLLSQCWVPPASFGTLKAFAGSHLPLLTTTTYRVCLNGSDHRAQVPRALAMLSFILVVALSVPFFCFADICAF